MSNQLGFMKINLAKLHRIGWRLKQEKKNEGRPVRKLDK